MTRAKAAAVLLVPSADSSASLLLTEARVEVSPGPTRLEAKVTRLFDELRVPVLRYLMTLGVSAADGDEIAQEVFLLLFQHLQQGKPDKNLRGWVFRVAHNLGLKRRYGKHAAMVSPEADWTEAHRDPRPTPEEQVADRQRQERLLSIVRALPEQDRCCLHLRAEGLRYREIAKTLGMSLGAVSLSLQRSLARLNRCDGR